jgi:hypothetical protein
VRYRTGARHDGLVVERATSYAGFELDRTREPLGGEFPPALADRARLALAQALVAGVTAHPDQRLLTRSLARLDEYWRRSGGRLTGASSERVAASLAQQLRDVGSWHGFLERRLRLEPADFVDKDTRHRLDALPGSLALLGDRVPLHYDIENGQAVVRLKLREGKARRLRAGILPPLDRPVRFTVMRGRNEVLHAGSIQELAEGLARLDRRERRRRER